jgi:uncharacterized protein
MTQPHPFDTIAGPMLQRVLQQTRHALHKAHQQGDADGARCMAMRLAPDMLCLAQQVQVLADGTQGGLALLTGDLQAPTAAWVFNRGEALLPGPVDTRLEQALARIDVALAAYVQAAQASPPPRWLAADATLRVSRPGHSRVFIAGDFVWQYLLPNTYFHATMVYALLRHAGVILGKADFEGPPAYRMDV